MRSRFFVDNSINQLQIDRRGNYVFPLQLLIDIIYAKKFVKKQRIKMNVEIFGNLALNTIIQFSKRPE